MDEGQARATVTGPVEGGSHGWAFGGPTVDFAPYGFLSEEFFLEGTAVRYRLQEGATRESRWQMGGRAVRVGCLQDALRRLPTRRTRLASTER